MFIPLLIAVVVGYLLGSLPFGHLVARAKGVDIFAVGSNNPGATNVRRVLGHGPGNWVLFLDALKGALASAWALLAHTTVSASVRFDGTFAGLSFHVTGPDWVGVGVGGLLGALLGHAFSCFTRFRGGKGVATGAGGFLVLFPLGTLVAAAVWGLTLALTRYASLASILAALALPLAAWLLHGSLFLLGFTVAAAAFVIVRHRANVARLLAGTESRIGQTPSSPP